MSDGDNATPGRRRLPTGHPSDGQRITRSPRPLPAAAPWERQDSADAEPTGSHSDGITVADLIAKVGATSTGSARHRMPDEPEPTPEPAPPPPEPAYLDEAEPGPAYAPPHEAHPTDVIPVVRIDPDVDEPLPEPFPESFEDTPPEPDTIVLPVYRPDAPRRLWRAGSTPPPPDTPDATSTLTDTDEVDQIAPGAGRRTLLAGRIAVSLIAVLSLVLTGGAWQWQSSKNNRLNKVAALDLDSRDIVDPNAQFGDENFLIVGTDSRFGDNAGMGAGDTEDAGGARSDTIMLVNIPANRERVVAVSFPRDLSITPMECTPWNPETTAYGPLYDEESGTYGPDEVYTETKLNSAFAFGGPKCLVKVIQKLSGLSINRFMAVDFAGFSKMVDALGGVEVCSTTPLEDYELGTVLPNAGRQLVDGHTALNYVRARQVTTEYNGDYGRIKRQQLFLSSLLRSLISKDTFFSLTKLNNVVNMFIADSYVDNISTRELVDLGQSVQGVNAGRISFVTVPTVGYADEWGNEVPRTEDMDALFTAIINDEPLPGEKNPDNTPVPGTPESAASSVSAAPTGPADGTDEASVNDTDSGEMLSAVLTEPEQITVQVSNSTDQTGLAATAATELEEHGFNVNDPDDYPGPLTSTTVFFAPGNEEAAATVASAFTDPTMERVTGMGNVVRVVLGSDFYSVNAPSPSGSQVQVHVLQGTMQDISSSPTELPEDLAVTNAADATCE